MTAMREKKFKRYPPKRRDSVWLEKGRVTPLAKEKVKGDIMEGKQKKTIRKKKNSGESRVKAAVKFEKNEVYNYISYRGQVASGRGKKYVKTNKMIVRGEVNVKPSP